MAPVENFPDREVGGGRPRYPWSAAERGRPDERAGGGRHARISRSAIRAVAPRHEPEDRIRRRAHDFPDDALHRVRESADPRQCRHGQGRGVRRDLHRGRGLDPGDGALRQLSDRARARHGAQRLLRLHGGADLQIYLAAGARGGVLLGRVVLSHLDLPHPRIRHQRDPEEPEARHLGGRRALPRHHRARGGQDRGRPSGHAGDPGRPQAAGRRPLPARLRADRRPQCAPGHRRHPDRHPGRDCDRPLSGLGPLTTASYRRRPRSRRPSCSSISRASPSRTSSSSCSPSCLSICSTMPAP